MFECKFLKHVVTVGALVCALLSLPQSVLGVAIYSAEVDVSVTVGPLPPGTGAAVIPGPIAFGFGGFGNWGAAGGAASVPFAFGLDTSAFADGFAGPFPPASGATSFGLAEGTIELLNANPFAVVIPFLINFEWSILAETTVGVGESASAEISFAVFLDGVLIPGAAADAAVSIVGGPGLVAAADAGLLAVAALLAPGLHIIDIDPDARGSAAATPEPSTLFLFGVGVLGILGYGWRRQRKAARKT